MNDRINQNKEFELAKIWLDENGKLTIIDSIKNNFEEFQLTYIPNDGKGIININGSDSMLLIIELYQE